MLVLQESLHIVCARQPLAIFFTAAPGAADQACSNSFTLCVPYSSTNTCPPQLNHQAGLFPHSNSSIRWWHQWMCFKRETRFLPVRFLLVLVVSHHRAMPLQNEDSYRIIVGGSAEIRAPFWLTLRQEDGIFEVGLAKYSSVDKCEYVNC